MCNLYRMTRNVDEIARLFSAQADSGVNFVAEVYPGYPGLVVAEGRARAMTWGFPLALTGKQGQKLKPKPVTNAREDKLTTAFWRDSFARRRCIIPVTQWAEPQGRPGQMTRSWYSLPDTDVIAVAGLWRPTAEWGLCYTMVMADSSGHMIDVHDRMPVLLAREHWDTWQTSAPEEAFALCRTWQGPLVAQHTNEKWATGVPIDPVQPDML